VAVSFCFLQPSMTDSTKPAKSKKPANTAFKQQRLRAWQPILTPKTVLPTFFVIGALFIPLGIGLFIASEQVNQIMLEYTYCKTSASPTFSPPEPPLPPITQWKYDPESRNCTMKFSVESLLKAPVFIYYRLTNFYQNHRRYVKSFDAPQLLGKILTKNDVVDNCSPIADASAEKVGVNNSIDADDNAQYYPCGLIANSLFLDEISDPQCKESNCISPITNSQQFTEFPFTQTGISWPSDTTKFGTSEWLSSKTSDEIQKSLIPPPAWRNASAFGGKFVDGYTKETLPDLKTFEKLHVWMRTAGLPNFRKLWGRNDGSDMGVGEWEIVVQDNFEVQSFKGTKSIVISTISILGGKNPFLGIAYMVVGGVCVLLGLLFLIRHMVKPRKLGDHTYLSWNQTPGGVERKN